MNGWDIRKALQLGMRSNPVLHEWLVSPIVYGAIAPMVPEVAEFVSAAADRAQYLYHYDRMARAAWEQISQDSEQVKVKRYCYGLRPALTLRWLKRRTDLPAMDAAGLCAGIGLKEEVLTALADLFTRKRTAGEQDLMPRIPVLDSLIADALAEKSPRPAIDDLPALNVAEADRVFRRVLDQAL
jgi:predicted nucleotidyltransferase